MAGYVGEYTHILASLYLGALKLAEADELVSPSFFTPLLHLLSFGTRSHLYTLYQDPQN